MADTSPPCSVVLEGGVTSAVIYASLLAQLSRDHSFRDLGGTSSGAVAAAAAAAAEYARCHVPGQARASFEALGRFPAELARLDGKTGRTRLYRLFQPQHKGRASFAVAMAALDRRGTDGWGVCAARVVMALVRHFWPAATLLAMAVAGVGWILADAVVSRLVCGTAIGPLLLCAGGWLLALSPTAVAALLALGLWALGVTVRALRDNHWGLCSGSTEAAAFEQPALTPTLHGFFESLAGPNRQGPLTFGDLWWGPQNADGPQRNPSAERLIDLQIITTAVSLARPYRLPGEIGDDPLRSFFYDADEWAGLFPPDILAHLKAHARPATLLHDDGRMLLALPAPQHWPVLMAARFSLSFPLLLSAVPMYIAVPRREKLRAGAAGARHAFEARKVYFSDGGITSNCPVHLFDAPLPRFPTFGVNLYKLKRGQPLRVSRSDTQDPELDAAATADAALWKTPLPFLRAMLSTALDWRDSLQRSMPGYRERMVHIGVPPEAGGLHLAMTPATIALLAELGVEAATKLHDDFSTPRSVGEATAWERHRWTRARTSLSALHEYLAAFAGRLVAGQPDYARLLRTATPQHNAFQDDKARQQALALIDGSRELVHKLEATAPVDAMDRNTPQPRPELHLSPPW